MRSSLVGFTDYSNQSLEEITMDYKEFLNLSKKIIKEKRRVSKLKTQGDIQGIFLEIILFSEKFVEFFKQSFLKIKAVKVDLFTIQELKRMGESASTLDGLIAKIWHSYDYDIQKPIEKCYCEFRSYIVAMIDLTALSDELGRRYFIKGKNIYKSFKKESPFIKFYEEIKDWIKILKQ